MRVPCSLVEGRELIAESDVQQKFKGREEERQEEVLTVSRRRLTRDRNRQVTVPRSATCRKSITCSCDMHEGFDV